MNLKFEFQKSILFKTISNQHHFVHGAMHWNILDFISFFYNYLIFNRPECLFDKPYRNISFSKIKGLFFHPKNESKFCTWFLKYCYLNLYNVQEKLSFPNIESLSLKKIGMCLLKKKNLVYKSFKNSYLRDFLLFSLPDSSPDSCFFFFLFLRL